MAIKWREFASSCIASATYDDELFTLTVKFRRNKSEYTHGSVPLEVWEEFSTCEDRGYSVGCYYNDSIKGIY